MLKLKNAAELVLQNNKDADVAYALGRTYMELENAKGCRNIMKKAIALRQQKTTWMNELGVICFLAQVTIVKTVVYFNKAIAAGFNKTMILMKTRFWHTSIVASLRRERR